jgi:MEMO1 family protein
MSDVTIDARQVRESAIAGTWYPGRRADLTAMLDGFLAAVPPQILSGELVALIVPHAGYVYSGQVAAHAYKLLAGKRFDVVAVISPSHRLLGGRALVTRKRYYRTPLGLVDVDVAVVAELAKDVALTALDHDEEHSLEIQLPFLQYMLGGFHLVPIMLEDQTYANSGALGQALAKTLAGRNALLVASTDLSHFHRYEQAVALDHRILAAMERFDPVALDGDVMSGRAEACGYGAVVAVLVAAKTLGADKVTVLHYANSGDVTGDHHRVVGYGAAIVTKEPWTKEAGAQVGE